jgi:Smg protein
VKENVLDVLMYLFENYVDEGPHFPPDREVLASELAEAGFARGEISKAFFWLEGLSQARDWGAELLSIGRGGMRHYHPAERKKLDEKCRGFLHAMESAGALDAATRELVLERVMALEIEEISVEQLKWVMWMVLFHQPGQEYAHRFLEDLVFEERQEHLH